MNLPLDYRRRPFKPKYLHEETPMFARWFAFGQYPDGSTQLTDGTVDVLDYVPLDVAERLIAARHVFVDTVLRELSPVPGESARRPSPAQLAAWSHWAPGLSPRDPRAPRPAPGALNRRDLAKALS